MSTFSPQRTAELNAGKGGKEDTFVFSVTSAMKREVESEESYAFLTTNVDCINFFLLDTRISGRYW